MSRKPGQQLLVPTTGVAQPTTVRGKRRGDHQIGGLQPDRVVGRPQEQGVHDPLEPLVGRTLALQALEEPAHAVVDVGHPAIHHHDPVAVAIGKEPLKPLGDERQRRGVGVLVGGKPALVQLAAGQRDEAP